MSTSRPRQLMSPGPRHLAMSRWPWRLGLVAFGLTTAVLAALVTSATLSPQPSPPRRVPPSYCRPLKPSRQRDRVDPHHRPAGADHRTHPLDPLDPIPDTVPLAVSRPTTTPGPARVQAPRPPLAGRRSPRHSRPLVLPPSSPG